MKARARCVALSLSRGCDVANTLNVDVARIPLSQLTPYQCALIELRSAMQDIRVFANERRLRWWTPREIGKYYLGILHGIRYSWSSILIFQTGDYYEFARTGDAFMLEAEFLLGAYQGEA